MHAVSEAMEEKQRIPRIAAGGNPEALSLSPAEGFLLSRIDGHTHWRVLCEMGGLAPDEAERCLERWLEAGILVLDGETDESGAATPEPPGRAIDEGVLDPQLDISLELQRDILEAEAGLARDYYQLLDIDRDADARAIKRAYFSLSRRFHPDRYFRREVGHYGARLERIFKRVVEAYELLSDPSTRAEIDRTLGPPPPPPPPPVRPVEAAAPSEPQTDPPARKPRPPVDTKREALERLRRRFRIPDKVKAERRFKAQQFYASGKVAARREQWKEASSSLKLAIAFDPWNDEYKSEFASIQSRVNQARAAELLERAHASWDDRAQQEALHLYEEAIAYRPRDAAANSGAARAALELGDLERAREYAETACELEPEVAGHQKTLAKVLRKAGIRDGAREALEAALRLAPGDPEAMNELKILRRTPRRSGTGGPR